MMKKFKIIATISIFLISSLLHNLYQWSPNFITSLISPVNESIWEHLKLIFITYLIWGTIEYCLLRKKEKIHNFTLATLLSALCAMLLTISIFTPIYFYVLNYQDNIFVTLSIYSLAIIISQLLSNHILQKQQNDTTNKIAFFFLITLFILFAVTTYYPPKLDIFYDFSKNHYGIKK